MGVTGGNGGDGFGFLLIPGFGGDGGRGGNGNSITSSVSGSIITSGNNRYGIIARSNGGNGGDGGDGTAIVIDDATVYGSGGDGGQAGSGGDVNLINSASLTTNGTGSYGIFAQSLGGIGGNGGSAGGLVAKGGAGAGKGNADKLTVTGTADARGTITAAIVNPGAAAPGYHEVTILSAAGGFQDSGLTLNAPTSAVAEYGLLKTSANNLAFTYNIDFSPAGMTNQNKIAFGDYINNIQLAGGSTSTAPLVASLTGITDLAGLQNAYTQLTPEGSGAMTGASIRTAVRFNHKMFSCPDNRGKPRYIAQKDCRWMRLDRSDIRYQGSSQTQAYSENVTTISVGMQQNLNKTWMLGSALSIDETNFNSISSQNITGNRIHAGIVFKRNYANQVSFSGALSTGFGRMDMRRSLALSGINGTLTANMDTFYTSATARFSKTFETSNQYVRPILELGMNFFRTSGFSESGGLAGALQVDANSEMLPSLRLALEGGHELQFTNGNVLRLKTAFGVTRFGNTSGLTSIARLAGAPAGSGSFLIRSGFSRYMVDVKLGADLFTSSDSTYRTEVDLGLGPQLRSSNVAFKFSGKF